MKANQVYIDVRPLLERHLSGIGRYVEGLLLALQGVLSEDPLPGVHFRFVTPESTHLGRLAVFDGNLFPVVKLPIRHGAMNYLIQCGLFPPLDLFLGKGLFVFPNYTGMPTIRSESIVFVYDLSFVVVPEFVHPRNLEYLRNRVPQAIRKAKTVVTISESSRDDIVKHYGVDPEKISVIYPSIDYGKFRRSSADVVERIKNKYGIDGGYLLFVGNIEPRKNIAGILEAYRNLGKGLRDVNSLVLIGSSGWLNDEITRTIRDYQSKGYRIILPTSYVGDDDLPGLYSGANLLVFPSHYEGFGIPLLEAMACGTPILTSPNSSIPEVAADAAQYVDPRDPGEIAKGIEAVLTDEVLKRSLVQKGLRRVDGFTWRKSAEAFRELIRKSFNPCNP